MSRYEVCVMDMETYTVTAESEEDAIIEAIDCFKNDDEYYGSEEAENVTEEDCVIMCFEEG